MEEVVYAKGQVRPVQNISLVKNIVAGEIVQINYVPGQKIEKGSQLLKIDAGIYSARKEALQTYYDEVNKKIEGVKNLIKSYNAGKNLISKKDSLTYARFMVYKNEKEILTKRYNMVKKLWLEALELPATAVQPARLRELKYQSDIAELDLTTYKNKFINSLLSELDALLIEKERVYSQLKDADLSLKNTCIISPISGYVQEISSLNKGDYINAGQSILNIVPDATDNYKIEIRVPAKDAGKITENMKIKYRFTAFPYHEFGGLTGEVINIEPDSFIDRDGSVYFAVTGNLDKNILVDKEKKEYRVKPGLEIDARIILKEQSILWHFLKTMDLVW
ncbi:HlyD family efflux transporter periplasmic adaptor subunit [Treponema sp. OMZ 788]|nr:HlyD family efflux transporter periplasmic adaptor subunit [Treponema sp. OMZ 788]